MPLAVLSSRQARVAHHANQAPARHQGTVAVAPHPVNLAHEPLVIDDFAHLAIRLPIRFQRPVWRQREHQMHALHIVPIGFARIAVP